MSPPDYFTPRSEDGSWYPRSGVLVGFAAELLRLKSVFANGAKDVGAKTAQRYFAGTEPVSEEAREAVLSALLDELLPEAVAPELAIEGVTDREHVRATVLAFLADYDRTVTALNGPTFRLTEPAYALVPYARLATLDLGMRWGAYQWKRARAGAEPRDLPSWLEPHALRDTMDRYREGTKLTLAELARECEVSENTMDAWRSGESLPTREGNVETLAEALADHAKRARSEVLFALRLAVAGTAIRKMLETRLGPPAIARELAADLLGAFATTARLTREMLEDVASTGPGTPEHRRVEGIFATILTFSGARTEGAEALCRALANRATSGWNQNVAYDFLALPGDRFERLAYWSRIVGSFDFERKKMREHAAAGRVPTTPFVEDDELWELLSLPILRMDGYDEPVDLAGGHVLRIKNPPLVAGYNRAIQATQARSVNDFARALEHIRAAIKHQPENAHFHFKLGAYLGELVAVGYLHLIDEAIQECEIAYALDPSQGQPVNEIAIIKSNARLYEEAEAAFARAAPLCDWWEHHHFGRGNNLLPLHRYEEARRSFERCLEIDPTHGWAKKRLAAVLWTLGDKRAARSWAAKARADDGIDPLADVERWLTLHLPLTAD